jgi:hypothetical protein
MIHLLREPATKQQVEEMLEVYGTYLKVAVDVGRGTLAGGGKLHADCEAVLLEDGSAQADVWGADWVPESREVRFESLINMRPRLGNRSVEILIPQVRAQVEGIVRRLFDAR